MARTLFAVGKGIGIFALLAAAASGTPLSVPNFSFETASLTLSSGDGPYSEIIPWSTISKPGGTLGSWIYHFTTTASATGAFAPDLPDSGNWATAWWSGSNVGYLELDSPGSVSLTDLLTATLSDDTTYTLTVDIGRRAFTPNFNYAIELLAGGHLLGSASNLALPHSTSGTSGTDTLTFISGAANPFAGQALTIALVSTDTSSIITEAFFDNVRLDASPSQIPEPRAFGLSGIGLVLLFASRCRVGIRA